MLGEVSEFMLMKVLMYKVVIQGLATCQKFRSFREGSRMKGYKVCCVSSTGAASAV